MSSCYSVSFRMHQVEKAMATHSSTLACKIPWTEELGRLQSMGSLRIEHDWATSLSFFSFMHWRRQWQPTPALLPGESQAQSRTRLKRLSSSRMHHDNHIFQTLIENIAPNPIFKHNIASPHTDLQTMNAGEDMEKMECSYTVGGNVNWYSHYGRWYGDFFKN